MDHPIVSNFLSLCAIPHPSHHEEAISAFLHDWGVKKGLKTVRDEAGNVILDKPASPGCESAPVTILGGAFLVIPPDMRHRAVNTAGTPSVHLGTRWRPPSGPVACSPFTALERKAIFATLADRALAAQTIPPDLTRVLRELFAAVENDEPDAGYVRLLAWTVLSRTARAMRFHGTAPREDADAVVRAVANRIRRDCGEHVRMADLIAFSGYSQTRFFTLFREKMGLSPNQFLTRCRIDKAKQLLMAPDRPPLQEIALSCGFATASHFAATFRRYEGVTPSSTKRR